jgi:tetratricopeptide (TPR) repeat protein
MGPTFNDIHHYCWGLMKTNRAMFLVRSQQYRTFYLNSSIEEFDYVIRLAPSNFQLLPEILTKKGENLIRLDRGQEAMLELERATELKPDYWPPYAAMSDYYRKIGDLGKAREWLEAGLSVTPDVNALKRRMAEIDGAKDNRTTAPQRPERQSAPQSSVEKSAAQLTEPKSPAEH